MPESERFRAGDAVRHRRFGQGKVRDVSGSFTIPIAKTLPLEQAGKAHREVEGGGLRGKIMLRAA